MNATKRAKRRMMNWQRWLQDWSGSWKVEKMVRAFIEVGWDETRHRLVCQLPLTKPTGSVQVKRNGQPVATIRTILQARDIVEWQIAYRDEQGNSVELGRLLQLAWQHGLLTQNDLAQLRSFVSEQDAFCDEAFAVVTEQIPQEFAGFRVWWRKHPVLRQDINDEATIEIEVRHRQRAVGFQAMVFLLVPLHRCKPNDLVERTAKPKEQR